MFAGTALSVRLFVCAGLSLFIIYGLYLYVVVCVFYAYNLTFSHLENLRKYSKLKEDFRIWFRLDFSWCPILTSSCDWLCHL